jgi:anti-sigma regulatory factor (Ser/Thr protein kinase)
MLRVEASLGDDRIEVAVSDDGPGFFMEGPISSDHPPTESPRGYGLFLMRFMADELEFKNDGKTVWFLKRFQAQQSRIN